uniref:Uncharacterized protein n=1 Tax=Opuntia streptacantha TaxID=393608 RepID=A0A7C9DBT6_OPUST
MRGKISLLVSCQLWERNKFVALRTLARTRVIASENYLPSTVSSLTKCIGDPCCVCRQSFEVKSIENEPHSMLNVMFGFSGPYFSTVSSFFFWEVLRLSGFMRESFWIC